MGRLWSCRRVSYSKIEVGVESHSIASIKSIWLAFLVSRDTLRDGVGENLGTGGLCVCWSMDMNGGPSRAG